MMSRPSLRHDKHVHAAHPLARTVKPRAKAHDGCVLSGERPVAKATARPFTVSGTSLQRMVVSPSPRSWTSISLALLQNAHMATSGHAAELSQLHN